MTDRELLEAAAKAAGNPSGTSRAGGGLLMANDLYWNSLTNSGDAFELAVVLNMPISYRRNQHGFFVVAEPPGPYLFETEEITNADAQAKLAATRRAIVRAAAEIGRSME